MVIKKARVGCGSAARPCSHSGNRTGGSAISPAATHDAASSGRTSVGRDVAIACASSRAHAEIRVSPAWIGEAWVSPQAGPSQGPAATSAMQRIFNTW